MTVHGEARLALHVEIDVEADAMSIPDALTISVEGLEAGSQILAKDVELPEGTTLVADEELLVVNVSQQVSGQSVVDWPGSP